ncbi:right-handed parallel beta-helix repeat-containing protein [Pseudomonas sp. Irchel s3b5]|uniref:right-handed parallel beta-helix repeat-containing protein n=1 Tax=Pseudomonas sp. Irchel s3b5 TaxID=2009077 RepID=UPI000BA33178|nr:right-handed parallel beta-helix repeat-containing protein [Pseudomonas sp. Irchel s3b5]
MPRSLPPSAAHALLCFLCCTLLPLAQAQSLLRHQLSDVPATEQQQEIERVLQAADQGVDANQVRESRPVGRASVSLSSLFSSQEGSWPFEPFVHNGLFRVIASYQTNHPLVVVVRGGGIGLAQLHQALGDERVMSRHNDGYLLSYPLLIAPGAALNIVESTLYLRTQSGTALINQGDLTLKHATLTSWSDGQPAEIKQPFRPFVMAWAGSRTRIIDSSLSRLGYNAHLARGLTLARSTEQALGLAPAILLMSGSRISELSSGVELQKAEARIENNRFDDLQQYALDLLDSRASLVGNHIATVKNQSAIRLRGTSSGVVERNVILGAGKAGIEVLDQQGELVLRQNMIGATQNGIFLRQLVDKKDTPLLLAQNYIANTASSGIDGEAIGTVYVIDNRISTTPEYAISMRNPTGQPSRLVLVANRLANAGKAMIRTEGIDRVVLGDNHYQMGQTDQQLMAGDLMPVQSLLVEATVMNPCIVEVWIWAEAGTSPPASLPGNCLRGNETGDRGEFLRLRSSSGN